ncbi:MAG: cyclic pyranopterin monophosphate synthase MoaC [Pelagibacterales bacterium]|nr:cyclic pyranopterin monophosphate synthase MoaC [Pelagibacterales bacterium]|tara:strand:- start:1950 stop:2423 length:474 start_codon:yes stop_codon:yes gene_type:complete
MKSSHFDNKGSARMIDVSSKKISKRIAIACSKIFMKKNTFDMIKNGSHKKGDVLAIARIAAIMSVKKTHDLIPLCHPINVEAVEINFKLNRKDFSVESLVTCKTTNKTGIEMEALTASSVAALTIYDMCKSVDKSMKIDSIMLTHKSGGRTGTYNKK